MWDGSFSTSMTGSSRTGTFETASAGLASLSAGSSYMWRLELENRSGGQCEVQW